MRDLWRICLIEVAVEAAMRHKDNQTLILPELTNEVVEVLSVVTHPSLETVLGPEA